MNGRRTRSRLGANRTVLTLSLVLPFWIFADVALISTRVVRRIVPETVVWARSSE